MATAAAATADINKTAIVMLWFVVYILNLHNPHYCSEGTYIMHVTPSRRTSRASTTTTVEAVPQSVETVEVVSVS